MRRVKEPQLFILFLLVSFASVSAVLYTPALPLLREKMHLTPLQAQLSMTAFLIGFAFGNLPYGPLSNGLGRKIPIFVGISLAIIGSLTIIFAGWLHAFWLLILGRFIAALGSSVGMKITFTMIGDIYSGEIATKKISYMMLSLSISPGIATALGGVLTTHLGWESCFYFLTIYSGFILLLSFFLPETLQERDLIALNLRYSLKSLINKFKQRQLLICSILMGCTTSVVYLFAAKAPFIGINIIGLKPSMYGFLNFIPPVGMVLGSMIAHQLAGKMALLKVISYGIIISLVGSLLMIALFLAGWINLLTLFLPMPLIYSGFSLIFTNASALAMTGAKNKSNASAVMNFINIGMSVIALTIVEAIAAEQPYVMPLAFLCLIAMMLYLTHVLTHKQ